MKKICYVTTVSSTLKVFLLSAAKYIHEHTDWEIHFICSNDPEWPAALPEYIHFHPVHMERGISLSGLKAEREMREIFRKEKFDLVQFSTPNASLYAAMAAKQAKVPVRLYCQWGIAYVGFSGVKRTIFKKEERYVCSLATKIEPDSPSNLRFAVSEGLYKREKGEVIWNGSACGVDLEKFDLARKEEFRRKIRARYGIQEEATVFGFVGRINGDKGINEFFGAFRKLCEGREDLYLLLVGDNEKAGDVSDELYSWARASKNVIFCGFTNVVEQYLSAMDCYVLPSYREGFGMGVVEAEAMNVPVVITNIPGPTDAMTEGKTGLIIKKKDEKSLYEALQIMAEQPERRAMLGANGNAFVRERFDQKEFFRIMLEDRKKLLGVK